MNFSDPKVVEEIVWSMRQADLPRSSNRSLIDSLFNGYPPYTDEEAEENNIATNVNFLDGTRVAADARRQFSNAFLKTGNFFTVSTDAGPTHMRRVWSHIITTEMNRVMKRRLRYLEMMRSTFASVVLHGIGPVTWPDRDKWCPMALGIADVLMPSNTLLTFDNLQYFAVFQQYTAAQLWRMTHGPKVDPGWNVKLAEQACKWASEQYNKQSGYTETWSPEKVLERYKQDLGLFGSDQVPSIDCYEFYFWDDSGKQAGWRKRIVLDSPSAYETKGVLSSAKTKIGTDGGEWLYDSGKRCYGSSVGEIIHFQFGDTSAVAPFRYHSVRSLGFLLYAVCHLQNRLRCRFNDATFEHMLQYFRVSNPEDAERMTKIDLHHLGVIPEGVEFVKAADRWQVNEGLIAAAMGLNRSSMQESAAAYSQTPEMSEEKTGETATGVMARVNAANSLVGAMLTMAYAYQRFQYIEAARRFCKPNSKDVDVRTFRARCLHEGVSEDALNPEAFEVEPERVLGSGNKLMEIAMADKLMGIRQFLDPDAQREVDRIYVVANSDDPALASSLVPMKRQAGSDTVHDAQVSTASLMLSLPVSMRRDLNNIEYVETMLGNLARLVKQVEDSGGVPDAEKLSGLKNVSMHIAERIGIIAQDKNEQNRVRMYGNDLGELNNLIKAFEQRLAEQQQAQQQAAGGVDPETAAKVESQKITAAAKAESTRDSHAQRTAQREVQFRLEERRKDQQNQAEIQRKNMQAAVDAKIKADMASTQETQPPQGTE